MGEMQPLHDAGKSDPHSSAFTDGFGRFLIDRGLVDELAVRRAQRAQRQSCERFDLVLTRLGLVTETALAAALSGYLGLPLAAASDFPIAPVHADRLPAAYLKSHHILPLADEADRLVLAVADPFDADAIGAVAYLFEQRVACCIATPAAIDEAIERLYGAAGRSTAAAFDGASAAEAASEDDVRRLADLASEAPVIRLVQDLIERAAESRASDIHIEPATDCLRVRYRIDGVLHTVERLPLGARAAVTSRIKVMARLNIAERRLPQDGRIKATVRGREIDMRVSTMPTLGGESVVMRLLDRTTLPLTFDALGLAGDVRVKLERLVSEPNGIVLVTGPTGSGKTTTLYTALATLNSPDSKIFTVEDPIEYQIAGINQIQVQPRIGLDFAASLRSLLRQDPDIMMIGEIRDLETAEIAIQASLTGHLVLSTVHTNNAAATITRLLDMGVESYLLASTVKAVLAQRLVRRLCQACAVPTTLPDIASAPAHASPKAARGCASCRYTGYSGRTMLAELLVLTPALRAAIQAGATESEIEALGKAGGMRTLYEDGVAKAAAGETSIDEVLRVTRVT